MFDILELLINQEQNFEAEFKSKIEARFRSLSQKDDETKNGELDFFMLMTNPIEEEGLVLPESLKVFVNNKRIEAKELLNSKQAELTNIPPQPISGAAAAPPPPAPDLPLPPPPPAPDLPPPSTIWGNLPPPPPPPPHKLEFYENEFLEVCKLLIEENLGVGYLTSFLSNIGLSLSSQELEIKHPLHMKDWREYLKRDLRYNTEVPPPPFYHSTPPLFKSQDPLVMLSFKFKVLSIILKNINIKEINLKKNMYVQEIHNVAQKNPLELDVKINNIELPLSQFCKIALEIPDFYKVLDAYLKISPSDKDYVFSYQGIDTTKFSKELIDEDKSKNRFNKF